MRISDWSSDVCCSDLGTDWWRDRVALDGDGIAIVGNQGVQCLDQMPGRAVDHCLERGMDVLARAAPPALAAGDQFQFDHALGAQADADLAVEILRGRSEKRRGGQEGVSTGKFPGG